MVKGLGISPEHPVARCLVRCKAGVSISAVRSFGFHSQKTHQVCLPWLGNATRWRGREQRMMYASPRLIYFPNFHYRRANSTHTTHPRAVWKKDFPLTEQMRCRFRQCINPQKPNDNIAYPNACLTTAMIFISTNRRNVNTMWTFTSLSFFTLIAYFTLIITSRRSTMVVRRFPTCYVAKAEAVGSSPIVGRG